MRSILRPILPFCAPFYPFAPHFTLHPCPPPGVGEGLSQQARNANGICIHANQARTLVIVILSTQLALLFEHL